MNPKVDLNEMRRLDAEAPSLGYAIPSALSLSKERTVETKAEVYPIRDHEHLVETLSGIFGLRPADFVVRITWQNLCIVGWYTFNIENRRFIRLECA
jgi:hypothetical protein